MSSEDKGGETTTQPDLGGKGPPTLGAPVESPTNTTIIVHHQQHYDNPKVYVGPVQALFGTFLTFALGWALYVLAPDETSDPRDVVSVLTIVCNVLWALTALSLLVYPRFFRSDDKKTMWACYLVEILKLTVIATKIIIAATIGHTLTLQAVKNGFAQFTSNIWTFVGGMMMLYFLLTFYLYSMVSVYMDILAFYHLVGDEATAGWSNTHAQLERNLRVLIPFSTRLYTRAKKAEDGLNEADRACTLICPCSCHHQEDGPSEKSKESEAAAQKDTREKCVQNEEGRTPSTTTLADNSGSSHPQGAENAVDPVNEDSERIHEDVDENSDNIIDDCA